MELKRKVALVTGGSRGIGASIVRRLARAGADVAFTYGHAKEQADSLVTELHAMGVRSVAIHVDHAEPSQNLPIAGQVKSLLGRIDILVNNIGTGVLASLVETDDALFDRVFDLNTRAAFMVTRETARLMEEGGRIINIGSMVGQRVPFEGYSLYSMTKFALVGLTRGWARDLAPKAITVNIVQPGTTNTDMNPEDGEYAKFMIPRIPLGRYGQPAEVAEMVGFLAGPNAAYITGSVINVDGGFDA